MADGSCTIRLSPGTTLIATVDIPGLRVLAVGGPAAGYRVALSLPVVRIGSAEGNDVVLDSPGVSRHHAEIRVEEGRLRVVDLGSTNGVWVGGIQVKDGFLVPGRPFKVGDTEMLVEVEAETRTGRIPADGGLCELVGRAPTMKEVFAVLKAVAPTHATVLLTGESGTGKEVAARTVHALSGRKGRFETFDAASTDPEMVRSDLFGHKKGAFTGADEARDGAFRRADGGTLFLDEIGELPLDLQSRLLRVLETREVQPLGSDEKLRVDVRLVAATHRNLEEMAKQGTFRLDLLHRLAVVPVRVPPLRERIEDLPLLIERLQKGLGLALQLSPAALEALKKYPWPGNVRELRNVLERAAALCGGQPAEVVHLGLSKDSSPTPLGGAGRSMAEIEKQAILATLDRNAGNRTAAARELGISVATLHRRLRDYGLAEEQ